MMIELKRICPFCGGEMIGTNGHPICHYNPDCIIHDESVPQEILDKLETTRKALDLATEGIEKMTWGCDTTDAERLLKQINEITKGGKDE